MKRSITLNPEVAEVYEPRKGVLQQFADSELGFIDLATLNLRNAKLVADRGYLVKKKKSQTDS